MSDISSIISDLTLSLFESLERKSVLHLDDMRSDDFLAEVGKNSDIVEFAEGWRGKIFIINIPCHPSAENSFKSHISDFISERVSGDSNKTETEKNKNKIGKEKMGADIKKDILKFSGVKLVLKIPRLPEFERNIRNEAEVLGFVNKFGIGPKLVAIGRNFFVSEFVEGVNFKDILKKYESMKRKFVDYLKDILFQARQLDKIGVSKDELHKPYSNIIVSSDDKVVLIDFESARFSEKPKNTTQFFSFFISFMKHRGILFPPDEKKGISLMKDYKASFSDESFENLLFFFDDISSRFLNTD